MGKRCVATFYRYSKKVEPPKVPGTARAKYSKISSDPARTYHGWSERSVGGVASSLLIYWRSGELEDVLGTVQVKEIVHLQKMLLLIFTLHFFIVLSNIHIYDHCYNALLFNH